VIVARGLLVAAAVLLVACSTDPPTPTIRSVAPSGQTLEPTASPPATVTPEPTSTAVVGSPGDQWGPLAVVPPQDGADTARTEGKLRITDACVSLDSPSGGTLLYWPADRTTWNAGPSTITFTNYDGTVVTVRDGDAVVLGGSGDSAADGGVSGQAWVDRTVWVARPQPSCALDQRWAVGAVGR
jgi:hypothetical protein